MKKLKIAMLGTRGVPARYGGFETCVEEIGKRLVAKGHEVTVYCRKGYYKEKSKEYEGMRLRHLPNISRKSLDTLSHSFISVIDSLFKNYDVYMVFNAANSITLLPLRLLGKKVAINTDGLEWKRSKWGPVGSTFYKVSEKLAGIVANRLVSDSKGIRDYYLQNHKRDSTKIAYGAYIQQSGKPEKILEMGLEPFGYFLQITRFEPENNPLLTIEAFKKANTGKKLVIVGGNPYKTDYVDEMEKAVSGRDDIILPGFIYDDEILSELWKFCFAYVHGNEVGGTNPALLQTMASGCFTISVDVSFNREVLGDCGIFFDRNAESLTQAMNWAVLNEADLEPYRRRAVGRISSEYSWDKMADLYEALFFDIRAGRYPWRPWRTAKVQRDK